MKRSNKIKFLAHNKLVSDTNSAPVTSSSVIPEWYKKVTPHIDMVAPKLYNGYLNSTFKMCTPLLDSMTAGYTYTLGQDVQITWDNDAPLFEWMGSRTAVTFHSLDQTKGFVVPDGYYNQIIKWQHDFTVETPKGYSLWCTHPSNRFDLPFLTLNGFVDTDTYPLSIQFPFIIKKGWTGILEQGTPLAQMIPVKREKWNSSVEILAPDDIDSRYENYKKTIIRSYKNNFWSRKDYS
jgi:hypothetical protein